MMMKTMMMQILKVGPTNHKPFIKLCNVSLTNLPSFFYAFDCNIENNDLQEPPCHENETDKNRPIKKWGKFCKAKLAIIAKLKK